MVQNERFLRDITASTALIVIVLGGAVLLLAVLAELQRRRTGHSRLVLLADRFLPAAARRTAVALITVLSAVTTVIGPQAASADSSVRDWLTSTTPTTGRPAPASPTITVPQFQHDGPAAGRSATPPATTPGSRTVQGPTPPVTTPPVAIPPAASVPVTPRAAPVVHEPTVASPSRTNQIIRPTGEVPAASGSTPATSAPAAVTGPALTMYQVVPGDCLWSIAARALGAKASSSAIDRGWRAIYAANQAAIGSDPNLIHPGLLLTLPLPSATP